MSALELCCVPKSDGRGAMPLTMWPAVTAFLAHACTHEPPPPPHRSLFAIRSSARLRDLGAGRLRRDPVRGPCPRHALRCAAAGQRAPRPTAMVAALRD